MTSRQNIWQMCLADVIKNIKKIERALHVTIAVREGGMKILGEAANVKSASRVFMELVNLSKRGNEITEQQVDYALDFSGKAGKCRCDVRNG